jgi:class 3 adenylate cyclase/tetratricopeptide (TPR) repeat protein
MSTQPAGSRSGTATILFTDLVGSTAQRVQLGEDAAEALRRAHDRLLAAAVAAHHGTVAKSVGDGIMATFPGAADAVAAAVAIQQAVDGHNRRGPPVPLVVRVGISLGDVTWEQGDCFGTPVIEAARLCGVAEGGQILVADLVRLTARGRGGHTFTPVGPVALKGLPEPVVACAVAWEPLEHVGLPLPPRLGTRPPFAMFGRGAEAEALALAWAKAKDGQRQVVLVAGEPGIGKTRLAVEAARAAHADGGTVLFGVCDEDVGLPYRSFVEALRYYVAHGPDAVLAAHIQTHRGELARLVPELARRLPDVPAPQVAEAETERFLLFEAVTGLLAGASRESPIVLLLDDLHWAGAPELLLLKHLVRSAEPMRLLVIGTYRDTELSRIHPLAAVLADLRTEVGVERMSLHGLDDAAVEALVAAAARHELDEALVALAHAIRRETEGNPFFIGEVIRHLAESRALFQERGRWTYRGEIAGLGIPEGVREVIGRRLGRLSAATSRMLALAAVIGRHFDVALLAKIAEASEDAVLDALDEATAAALVTEVRGSPEQFTFRHALIRDTLYGELSAPRRARLHQRVGEALEDLVRATPGARIEELAYHWLAATRAADVGKAVGYTRQAGERALAGLAFEEAAAHFERALGVLEPRDASAERLRCDLLLALGDAQRRAGDTRYRETVAKAAEVARALGEGERLARAALASARPGGAMASANLVDETLIALYEEASAALGDADSLLRARVLGQLAVELIQTPHRERRDALSREAVAIARRLGDQTGLAQVLGLRFLAMNDPFTLAERLELAAELAALAGELASTELGWWAAHQRTGALLESGDIGGAERALREAERLAGELRQPFCTWFTRIGRAMLAVMRGAPDAEAQVLATFELGTAGGQPDAPTAFGAQLSFLRHNQGRLAELADATRANVEAMPHMPAWRAALARLYSETDQVAAAREQVDILRVNGFDPPLNWTWTTYMVTLSEAVCDLHGQSAAEVLYERLRPVAGQVDLLAVMLASSGSYALYCGMLAACLHRWEDAARHFADALAMNERLGARPYVVRTRRAWAAMLLDRGAPGDAARARDLIAAGRSEAETLGMARELVRFERLTERMERTRTD